MLGPITIDQEMYHMALVLSRIDRLKTAGLLEGGYDINAKAIDAIITIGEMQQFPKPTSEQITTITRALQKEQNNEREPHKSNSLRASRGE